MEHFVKKYPCSTQKTLVCAQYGAIWTHHRLHKSASPTGPQNTIHLVANRKVGNPIEEDDIRIDKRML